MRALVTGISGFVGGFLAQRLQSNGWDVFGLDTRSSKDAPNTFIGSIHDQASVVSAINSSQPDVIFHFAGLIKSNSPQEYYTANVLGTDSLFQSIIAAGMRPRVLIASSSAVYGPGHGKRPISEKFALRPATDYAASKAAQEYVAGRYFFSNKIPIIISRTFNLVGPKQPPDLACSAFARQIAFDEKLAVPKPIRTGNLHSKRDFLDVRDAVKAYEGLALQGKPGLAYNICSGKAVSIHQCLDVLLGLSSGTFSVEMDLTKIQKNDIPVQVGNNRLAHETIGWLPEIPLKQSLQDLLNYWRDLPDSTLE